jgi:hypothetical protein
MFWRTKFHPDLKEKLCRPTYNVICVQIKLNVKNFRGPYTRFGMLDSVNQKNITATTDLLGMKEFTEKKLGELSLRKLLDEFDYDCKGLHSFMISPGKDWSLAAGTISPGVVRNDPVLSYIDQSFGRSRTEKNVVVLVYSHRNLTIPCNHLELVWHAVKELIICNFDKFLKVVKEPISIRYFRRIVEKI